MIVFVQQARHLSNSFQLNKLIATFAYKKHDSKSFYTVFTFQDTGYTNHYSILK